MNVRNIFIHTAIGIAALIAATTCTRAQVAGPFDVVYRTAANYRGGTDTLHLKWWRPGVKNNRPLPLIIWVHGGAFYAGAYTDMTSECERWAARGFIAVTVEYRLGYYSPVLLQTPYAYDRAEVVRACWRGMQDVRFAIRELVKGALVSGIDTSCVILAGESAGSIIVMQSAMADEADSIPREVDSIAVATIGFDKWPRPSLGDVDGYPLGSRRPFVKFPHICGILNRFGAFMHPYMLDALQFPSLFSYHQRGDLIVACGVNRGLYGMPLGVGDNFPVLTGTCALTQLLADGGQPASMRETMIVDGIVHGLHDPGLVQAHEATFVANVSCPSTTSVIPNIDNNQQRDVSQDGATWIAYDVLGRILASGTGGSTEAHAWSRTVDSGFVMICIVTPHGLEPLTNPFK